MFLPLPSPPSPRSASIAVCSTILASPVPTRVITRMLVPDELALELDEFDVLSVQLADDPGVLVVVEEGGLPGVVHLIHGSPSRSGADCPISLWLRRAASSRI
jgi:hypothetical protein